MKTLRFTTNINCGGCIKAVTPSLDAQVGVGNWKVNTQVDDKILEIPNTLLDANVVIDALDAVGFEAIEIAQ
jgi:copper chaperone CopZ